MSEAAYAFSPVSNALRSMPKGQWGIVLDGWDNDIIRGGGWKSIEGAPEVESQKLFSNETPTPLLAMTYYGQPDLSFTIEAEQVPAELAHAIYMSKSGLKLNQAAAVNQTKIFAGMTGKGNRRRLPHRDVTVTLVSAEDIGGDPVEYVKNTHYRVHKATGLVEITAHPVGVVVDADGKADVTIEYDAAAITDRPRYTMMTEFAIEAGLQFVSTNKFGRKVEVSLWKCEVKFDKIMLGVDGNEFQTSNITFTVIPDTTREAGLEYGEVIDFTDAV